MSDSTSLISGLSSGIDWTTIVDNLISIDHKRVDLVTAKKTAEQAKLAAWQSLNTKLLSLDTAVAALKTPEDFKSFKADLSTDSSTVKASDLLSVTSSASAAPGSYSVKVTALATAQKLSSKTFASYSSALGADYAGDLLINGRVVTATATDTLQSLRDKINNANTGDTATGVSASIVSYGANDSRLILTSDATGAGGIGLLNGGATDVLKEFGFSDSTLSAKNHLAGGDQSDAFASTSTSIKSLLGLSTTQTAADGNIVINGHAIGAIDLSTDTLTSLQTKFATAGVDVSVVSETVDGETVSRLMIMGTANTYTDKNNILQTLGILKQGNGDLYGVTGNVANTAEGTAITSATLLKDIDGYLGFQNTDYITFTGTDTTGGSVSDSTFTISDYATVADLLTKINTLYGDVTASISESGKLVIEANAPGNSGLAVAMTVMNKDGEFPNPLTDSPDGTLKFATVNDLGSDILVRKRQMVAGQDASLTIDGVAMTSSDNTVDDAISGVTLNLLKADMGTTISLTIGNDVDTIMTNISTFVTSYNAVSAFIQGQQTYDTTSKATGGVLFGDGTLSSIKSDLTSILVGTIGGISSNYSTLGLVGISVDTAGQLSIDSSKLRGYLNTNFDDVQKLFVATGQPSSPSLEFVDHSLKTKASGDTGYAVNITQAATKSMSNPSDASSLTGDETLTVTSGTTAAVISLTNGMTMAQVVNTINDALDAEYMGITATLDGSNHLVLTQDTYGTSTFTIEQANNLLWTGGKQTVNTGKNVAGTINGEDATGAGQVLTGNADDANVDGLSIKYTGSSPGSVGTIKLTLGVAELYSRAAFNITDDIDGYLAFKQDSIASNMSSYDTQISEMEARLALKKESLLSHYAAMETALSKLSSQSTWLTGQVAQLNKST
ncbi:MAG: flagellar filament capping protein FliD [Syntrophus sp. (in: bacteria)]